MCKFPLILAHRAGIPENTIKALKASLTSSDINGVEIDLRACKDRIVVFHDETLERATNGKIISKIKKINYSQLSKVKIFENEKIPTFDEVIETLSYIKRNFYVKLDLKEYDKKMKEELFLTIKEIVEKNSNVSFLIDLDEEIDPNNWIKLYSYWVGMKSENILLEIPGIMDFEILKKGDIIGYSVKSNGEIPRIPYPIKKEKMIDIYIERIESNRLYEILYKICNINPNFLTPHYLMDYVIIKKVIKKLLSSTMKTEKMIYEEG